MTIESTIESKLFGLFISLDKSFDIKFSQLNTDQKKSVSEYIIDQSIDKSYDKIYKDWFSNAQKNYPNWMSFVKNNKDNYMWGGFIGKLKSEPINNELIDELKKKLSDAGVLSHTIENRTRYILKENLKEALKLAIHTQKNDEISRGYNGDSGLLAGWKSALNDLEKNGYLEIR